MNRLQHSLVIGLITATAWAGSLAAQQISATITHEEIERHGFNVPEKHIMLVVISHTGSYDRPVTCAVRAPDAALRQEVGEVQAGDWIVAGVDSRQLVGRVWVQCVESAQARTYSSNDFPSVGHTVAHFSTGSKFVITQQIVP